MKIEMISDNQLRCILTKEDLAARHIKLSELSYSSGKARLLFMEMIEKAGTDYGFAAEGIPLMIEAIPLSSEGLILLISKLEGAEDADSRFSDFTAYDEDSLDDNMISDMDEINQPEDSPLMDVFKRLYDKVSNHDKDDETNSLISEDTLVLSFESIDDVICMSHDLNDSVNGDNSLYRSDKDRLLLVIHIPGASKEIYDNLCMLCAEYGNLELCVKGYESHIAEHYKLLIKDKALQLLAAM